MYISLLPKGKICNSLFYFRLCWAIWLQQQNSKDMNILVTCLFETILTSIFETSAFCIINDKPPVTCPISQSSNCWL